MCGFENMPTWQLFVLFPNSQDYENIGRSFCETLLDYADESPNKVIEMRRQIKNMRRRERKLRRARMKRIAAEVKFTRIRIVHVNELMTGSFGKIVTNSTSV